jgi:hydrogenase/urease accessory protein HupE
MAEAVYLLCALTSAACAFLLLRSYFRSRSRLLVWSSLAFVGLAINNALLFVDLVLIPEQIDLSVVRSMTGLAALMVLTYGLIWEAE